MLLVFAVALKNNAFSKIEASKLSTNDTLNVSYLSPSPSAEKKIFSDKDLNYKVSELVEHKSIWNKFLQWISNKLFGNVSFNHIEITRMIIFWLLFLMSAALVFWYIKKGGLTALTKPKEKLTRFNFSDITENINTIDFNKKINDALIEKDYRLAIRWHYLKSLNSLNEKQAIFFEPHKTNFEYVYEIKNDSVKNIFINLSKIYDYVWYGNYEIEQKKYLFYAESFSNLEKTINV
ncbi:MAG: hypothetical protein JSU07_03285 [Bacteroidetes bacterium]|nr:hypothetical protein [Bacteroidota bacterium]